MVAAEGLEVGGRVDVGDRRDLFFGVEHFIEFAPAALDLGQIGHVGHRAAGGKVGQDGDLVGRSHDVGDFGHEMHAAENHVFRISLRGQAGEFERITRQVGVLINVGALVMMAKDDGLFAKFGASSADALLAGLVREVVVRRKNERLGGLHEGLRRAQLGAGRLVNS